MTQEPAVTEEQILVVFTKAYRQVKKSERDVQPEDQLFEDLGIDSLDAIDMLMLVDDETGGQAFEKISANMEGVLTVQDLLSRILSSLAES